MSTMAMALIPVSPMSVKARRAVGRAMAIAAMDPGPPMSQSLNP